MGGDVLGCEGDGFVFAVVVGSAGSDEVELLGEFCVEVAVAGRDVGVVDFDAVEAKCGELVEDLFEVLV